MRRGVTVFGENLSGVSPLDLIGAALTIPVLSFVIAALAFTVAVLVRRRRPGPVRTASDAAPEVTARYGPEQHTLGWGAIGVIGVFIVESILRGYVWNLVDVASWWRHAVPLFSASIAILVILALVARRGTSTPQVPLLPAARRTWTSFGPRRLLPLGAAALGILVATTVAAGLASSADDRGRYIYLDIPVPNTTIDPVRPWSYGWTYGVPALIAAALLTVVVVLALRANATRPFLRPDTADAERLARRGVADGIVRIATAGVLLALAGAWRVIGDASIGGMVTVGDGTSEATYELAAPFEALARLGERLAPPLEVAAFLLLLLVARAALPRRAVSRAALHPVPTA